MKHFSIITLIVALLGSLALAQTEVKVYVGTRENPELIQELLDKFNAEHPDINATVELGGTTSEVQQQYLSTVLASKSDAIDIFLIDVIRPATYAAAGWAEPLNQFFDSEEAMMAYLDPFLQGPIDADIVNGTLYALPSFTDAQFLYYRKDLLDEYGFEPPETWTELEEQALAIMEGEGDPQLQGFNYQGAAIEGAVCTFLEPFWSAGGQVRDAEGEVTIDSPAGKQTLGWYDETLESGITIPNIAEVATDDSRRMFQAGDVIFMLNWGYAWAHFQGQYEGEETAVKGKVGVAALPHFEGHQSYTCLGGWQWAMNAYSSNKEAAWQVMQYLASEDVQRVLAVEASRIPARESLYEDPAVLEAAPHYGEFYEVIVNARPRPVTPRYDAVSEIIRTTTNAFLARSLTIDEALNRMQNGLEDIFAD